MSSSRESSSENQNHDKADLAKSSDSVDDGRRRRIKDTAEDSEERKLTEYVEQFIDATLANDDPVSTIYSEEGGGSSIGTDNSEVQEVSRTGTVVRLKRPKKSASSSSYVTSSSSETSKTAERPAIPAIIDCIKESLGTTSDESEVDEQPVVVSVEVKGGAETPSLTPSTSAEEEDEIETSLRKEVMEPLPSPKPLKSARPVMSQHDRYVLNQLRNLCNAYLTHLKEVTPRKVTTENKDELLEAKKAAMQKLCDMINPESYLLDIPAFKQELNNARKTLTKDRCPKALKFLKDVANALAFVFTVGFVKKPLRATGLTFFKAARKACRTEQEEMTESQARLNAAIATASLMPI